MRLGPLYFLAAMGIAGCSSVEPPSAQELAAAYQAKLAAESKAAEQLLGAGQGDAMRLARLVLRGCQASENAIFQCEVDLETDVRGFGRMSQPGTSLQVKRLDDGRVIIVESSL